MILVTGAAGKTGRTIMEALAQRGAVVRALVRREVKGLKAQEIVVGDMHSLATMTQAMVGVEAVYHICPNMSADELQIGQIAIAAARDAGVQRFVYHSVLHPQIQAMPHHWLKMQVEAELFESGIPYTILQPTAYMQNILAHWSQIVDKGIYPVPYSEQARLSLVHLRDVAEAAAIVLTQPEHTGAIYELVGTHSLSQTEVAAQLSHHLGREVRVERMPLDTWQKQAKEAGLGDYQIDTLLKMFQYYDRYGFEGNPNVLSCVLGRSPVTFAEFLQQVSA
jgi:uncharacterized protein YbjT (DUF2867 family)